MIEYYNQQILNQGTVAQTKKIEAGFLATGIYFFNQPTARIIGLWKNKYRKRRDKRPGRLLGTLLGRKGVGVH